MCGTGWAAAAGPGVEIVIGVLDVLSDSGSIKHEVAWRSGLSSLSGSLGGGAADEARRDGEPGSTADRVRWLAWLASWVGSISACGSTVSAAAGVAGEGDDGGGQVGHSILSVLLNLEGSRLPTDCAVGTLVGGSSGLQGCGICWVFRKPVSALLTEDVWSGQRFCKGVTQ